MNSMSATFNLLGLIFQLTMYVGISLFVGYQVRKFIKASRESRHSTSLKMNKAKGTRALPSKRAQFPHF